LQHIESGKGFGSSSSSSDPASAASEEDFGDFVGDDDDICFDEDYHATKMMIKFLPNILQT
jgi:hypothetical protein